jgi:thymidylate synthase (FAD)
VCNVLRDAPYTPPVWYAPHPTNRQAAGEPLPPDVQEWCTALFREHWRRSYDLYRELLALGCAREQARFVLPAWVTRYRGLWQIDCRNLMNVLVLRNDSAAQRETAAVAAAMEELFSDAAPTIYRAFVEWRDATRAVRRTLADARRSAADGPTSAR